MKTRSPAIIPQLLAVAVFVALATSEGGFDPTTWYLGALFLLGLLAVTTIVVGFPARPGRRVVVMLALFALFVAWSYVSITWANDQGSAWDGANRNAMYLVILAQFSLWPIRTRGAQLLIAAFSLGIAGVGLIELLRADLAAQPGGYFIDLRFAEPAGYINANVAIWTFAGLGCLVTAATRTAHPALRGPALAGTVLLVGLGLMGQSRGWALALPVGLIVLLALSPDRWRIAFGALITAAAVLLIRGPLLNVHDDYTPARFDALLQDAVATLVVAAVVVGLLGVLWAAMEQSWPASARPGRRLVNGLTVAVAVLAIAGTAVVSASTDLPDRVGSAWSDFKEGGGPDVDQSRFASAGSNRYDFWTVAWDAFRDQPLRGVGAENFQRIYLVEGNSLEKPLYPHSFELGVLSQLGLVGALLLLGAIGLAIAAALWPWPRPHAAAAAATGAIGVFAYWLAHASVDWFWEFSALTAPAIAMLGIAAAVNGSWSPTATRQLRRPLMAVTAIAAVILALSFAAPWLAARSVSHAAETWGTEPDAALDRLDRAASLNPLSTAAQTTAGTIALRIGRRQLAEEEFRAVLERDPGSAYAALELGLIASERGDRRAAVRYLSQAHALDPRDEIVAQALERVRQGRRVSTTAVNAKIVDEARSTLSRPPSQVGN